MKAFLLAAGSGTRLRPITDHIPKCLLPVGDTPLLDLWLDALHRAGVDEVLINLHAHAESVRQYLRQNANGIRVRVAEETELLGSAGTLRAATDPVTPRTIWDIRGDLRLRWDRPTRLNDDRPTVARRLH